MHCPKCSSTNTDTYYDKASAYTIATKGDRIFHCSACGLVLYGEAAEKVVREQLAKRPAVPKDVALPAPVLLRQAIVSASDLARAEDLREEAETLRATAKACRSQAHGKLPDDQDRTVNLALVDTGRAIGITDKVHLSRSTADKDRAFKQVEDILKVVRDRIRGLPTAERRRASPKPKPLPVPEIAVVPEPAVRMNPKHVGSDFDDFLKEEDIFDEVVAVATERALALSNPEQEPKVSEPEPDEPKVCAWRDCSAPTVPNSVYCSVTCKNHNARHRHKERKRLAPPPPPPPPPEPESALPPASDFEDMARAIRTLRERHAVPSAHPAAERRSTIL